MIPGIGIGVGFYPLGQGLTPNILSNLGLWLRGDVAYSSISPNVPAVNGAGIRRWPDLSGNSRNADQATSGLRPTLLTAGINANPAISFDGLDDFLGLIAGLNLVQNVAGATAFAVFSTPSAAVAAAQTIFAAATGVGTTGRVVVQRIPTGPANQIGGRRLDADSFAGPSGGATSTSPTIICGEFNYAAAIATLGLNGVDIATTNPFQTAGSTSNTASTAIAIGANAAGLACFPGLIAEIIVYQRILTAAEKIAINRYLGNRYNISVP